MSSTSSFGIYQPVRFEKEAARWLIAHENCRYIYAQEAFIPNKQYVDQSVYTDQSDFLKVCKTVIIPSNITDQELLPLVNQCHKIIMTGVPLLLSEQEKKVMNLLAESQVDFDILQSPDCLHTLTYIAQAKSSTLHFTTQKTFCFGSLNPQRLLQEIANDLFFYIALTSNRILKLKTQLHHNSDHELLVCHVYLELENGGSGILAYDQIATQESSSQTLFTSEHTYKILNNEIFTRLSVRNHLLEKQQQKQAIRNKNEWQAANETIHAILNSDLSMSKSLRHLEETQKQISRIQQNKFPQLTRCNRNTASTA